MKLCLAMFFSVVFYAALIQGSVWGQECNDECCYWYQTVPANVTCNSNQSQLVLPCTIITRRDPTTDVTVRWYHSQDQESARENGMILNNSTKYKMSYVLANTPLQPNSLTPLYIDSYNLIINSFNNSDSGYYWCQIVVNGTGLIPSLYGEITTSSEARQCSFLDTQHSFYQSPMCAESDQILNTTTQYISTDDLYHTSTSVDQATGGISTIVSGNGDSITTVPGNMSTPLVTTSTSCPLPTNNSTCIGTLVAIVIIAVVLVVLIVATSVICVLCKRKKLQSGSKRTSDKTIEEVPIGNLECTTEATQNTISDEHSTSVPNGDPVNGTHTATDDENLDHTYDSVDRPALTANIDKHAYNKTKHIQVLDQEYAVVVLNNQPSKSWKTDEHSLYAELETEAMDDDDEQTNRPTAKLGKAVGDTTTGVNVTSSNIKIFDDHKEHMYHELEDSCKAEKVAKRVTDNEYSTAHEHHLVTQDHQDVSGGDAKGIVVPQDYIQPVPLSVGSLKLSTTKGEAMYNEPILPMEKQRETPLPSSAGTMGDHNTHTPQHNYLLYNDPNLTLGDGLGTETKSSGEEKREKNVDSDLEFTFDDPKYGVSS